METQSNPDKNGTLIDGVLPFRVKRKDGTETVHECDLLMVKLTCEECERKHALKVIEGRYQTTSAFLADLALALGPVSGIGNCTPTIAWQIWQAVGDAVAGLKKTSE